MMPKMSNSLVARTAEALALFEQALARTNQALGQGDLSAASFPLVGDPARLELQTRASQLQWALEMLPSQHELQAAQQAASDPAQLRAQAAALLAQAAEMDGSDLYIIVHEHEYGQTPYFSWGAGFPSEERGGGRDQRDVPLRASPGRRHHAGGRREEQPSGDLRRPRAAGW